MEINKENFREILIKYLEKELSAGESARAEQYIRTHEDAETEWELLKRTQLKPDTNITFPNKQLLFRKEDNIALNQKSAGVFKLIRYSAIAVAAALIAFGILIYIGQKNNSTETAHKTDKNGINPTEKNQPGSNNMADMSPGPKKTTTPKIEINKKAERKTQDSKNQKKEQKQPEHQNEEPHRTILIVDQPQKENPMAMIQTHGTNEIENNSHDNDQALKPVRTGNYHLTAMKTKNEPSGDDSKSLTESLMGLMNKVSVKKKKMDDKTFYALSIETQNIKINKTFKSLIEP